MCPKEFGCRHKLREEILSGLSSDSGALGFILQALTWASSPIAFSGTSSMSISQQALWEQTACAL